MNWKKGKKIVAVFLLLALAVEMAGYHFISEKRAIDSERYSCRQQRGDSRRNEKSTGYG